MKPAVIKIFSANSDYQVIETLRRNRVKRNQSGLFFVEGVRSIGQAMANHWDIDALIFSRERRLSDWAKDTIEKANARRHFELAAPLMESLSQKEEPSEILALVTIPEDNLARIPVKENMLVVVLDRPAYPGNIGTIIRSCDAMQADGLIVSGHAADLYDPECIRGTTGSFFCVPSIRLPSHKELLPWIDTVRQQISTLQVVGTSARAPALVYEHDFTLPTILLIGNETHGLSENYKAVSDRMVKIPMSGYASSLNVACATSVLLYEIVRQRSQR